eukprot:Partr_v1_DN26227_c2_g2_i1_m48582 putative Septin 3
MATTESPLAAVPAGYVGFDTLTGQIEKKLLRKGFQFNIMVVGQTGLGKSTFVNTLFATHLTDSKGVVPLAEGARQTTEIHQVSYAVEENGVKLKLNIVDTPGFGDHVNNDYCWEPITRYIKDQYAMYLRKELSPTRDKRIADSRVHCVLYFIAPSGHSLRPLDIVVMKKLGEIANVIPVIGKSDSFTMQEREDFKKRIKAELVFHGISTYPASAKDEDETETEKKDNELISKMIPFAVVGSEDFVNVGGKPVRARRSRNGHIINIEDPKHCEFIDLRNFLIRYGL